MIKSAFKQWLGIIDIERRLSDLESKQAEVRVRIGVDDGKIVAHVTDQVRKGIPEWKVRGLI